MVFLMPTPSVAINKTRVATVACDALNAVDGFVTRIPIDMKRRVRLITGAKNLHNRYLSYSATKPTGYSIPDEIEDWRELASRLRNKTAKHGPPPKKPCLICGKRVTGMKDHVRAKHAGKLS